MLSSVLFPEPLGPMTATSSPRSTDRSTSMSACTSLCPEPWVFETRRSSSVVVIATPPLQELRVLLERPLAPVKPEALVSGGRRLHRASARWLRGGRAPHRQRAPAA